MTYHTHIRNAKLDLEQQLEFLRNQPADDRRRQAVRKWLQAIQTIEKEMNDDGPI